MPHSTRTLLGARSLLTTSSSCIRTAHSSFEINVAKPRLSLSKYSAYSTIGDSATRPLRGSCTGAARNVYYGQNKGKTTLDNAIADQKDKQTKAPWHREGSDMPPVARQRSAGAMTKGSRCPQASTYETDQLFREALNNTFSTTEIDHTSHTTRPQL